MCPLCNNRLSNHSVLCLAASSRTHSHPYSLFRLTPFFCPSAAPLPSATASHALADSVSWRIVSPKRLLLCDTCRSYWKRHKALPVMCVVLFALLCWPCNCVCLNGWLIVVVSACGLSLPTPTPHLFIFFIFFFFWLCCTCMGPDFRAAESDVAKCVLYSPHDAWLRKET